MELKLRVFTNGKMYGHAHALTLLYKRDILLEDVGEFIIMLCTGLKDRNGRWIYDGDIYTQGDKNIKYNVVFIKGAFIGNQIGNKSLAGLSHFISDIELIGNMHENPELLS